MIVESNLDENLKQKLIQENKFIDVNIFAGRFYRYFITSDEIFVKMLTSTHIVMKETTIEYCKNITHIS